MNKKNKKIIIIIISIMLLIILGCIVIKNVTNTTDKDINYHTTTDDSHATNHADEGLGKCYSVGLSLGKDDRVDAGISLDSSSQEFLQQDKFKLSELNTMSFGAEITETTAGIYSTYELCNLSSDTVLLAGTFEKSEYNYHLNTTLEDYGVSAGSKSQQVTSFNYDGEGGFIESIGRYAVNVYTATKNGEWEWAKSFEFYIE